MFLAILEMVRRQMLDLEQEEAYGDIRLRLRLEALDQPDDPLAADDSSPAP
jgi:chromatin segregation and condensation protein Rec8/ScpA/Scc1 (kleisin family)